MKTVPECTLADGFKPWEKVYAQSSFLAVGILGTIGVALVDWRWAAFYLFVYVYGIVGIVMRHLVCPRCPHLHVHNDCLQAPPSLTRWLIHKRKDTPFSPLERALFLTYFSFIPLFPVYWLSAHPVLLLAFIASVATWYLGQFLRFCKRCRVEQCPFNQANIAPPH